MHVHAAKTVYRSECDRKFTATCRCGVEAHGLSPTAARVALAKMVPKKDCLPPKCKWCGEEVQHHLATMCDGCWELDTRIRMDIKLAERILTHYKKEVA